jgi:hypothetical protein
MSTSDKKVAANRINGKKSHGPKNTSSTRFNALKHGLLALGLTERDDEEEYHTLFEQMVREWNPVGVVETYFVQSAVIDMMRCRGARRFQAEYITSVLNPSKNEKDPVRDLELSFLGPVVDPGLPAAISAGCVQNLVSVFQRYESFFANRLFRTLHELERMQRMRKGERLPAPIPVDVSGSVEIGPPSPVPAAPDVLPSDSESAPSPVTLDALHADHEVEEAPAEAGQEKVLRADRENLAAVAGVEIVNDKTGVVDSPPVEMGHEEGLLADDKSLAAPADVDVSDSESGKKAAPAPWRPRVRSGPIWSDR